MSSTPSADALAAYAAIRPRDPARWYVPATIVALAALSLVAWWVWCDTERSLAAMYWNHQTAVARVCLENGGELREGACTAPAISFSVIPFEAWPSLPTPKSPPPGSNVLPLPLPVAPGDRKL